MVAKLILAFNDNVQKEIPIDRETITIGRAAHSDIHIDNLAVSHNHAKILTILNDSFVEDVGSTNGTFVNNQRIVKHALKNGDVIRIVKHTLTYLKEGEIEAGNNFDKTMIIRPGSQSSLLPQQGHTSDGTTDHHSNHSESLPEAVIQVLTGPNTGKELLLTKALTTIGKPGVQVAVVTKRPNGYYLTHVEGNRLPIVNGTPIGTQAHALTDHAIIELAGIKLEFFYKL